MLSKKEDFGPTVEEDAEFAKELAKMLSDTSDARKVDKRSAQSILDPSVVHSATVRKKRAGGDSEHDGALSTGEGDGFMKFTVVSRKGNKQQVSDWSCQQSVYDGLTLELEQGSRARYSRNIFSCRAYTHRATSRQG